MTARTPDYSCLNCGQHFPITVSATEWESRLESGRVDTCPSCKQRVGTGPVVCRECRSAFEVPFPHWHVHCDLASGTCPVCGAKFESLCIC
jgi:DNA-directed RNA polymerase subunit RPC12/RpoP